MYTYFCCHDQEYKSCENVLLWYSAVNRWIHINKRFVFKEGVGCENRNRTIDTIESKVVRSSSAYREVVGNVRSGLTPHKHTPD